MLYEISTMKREIKHLNFDDKIRDKTCLFIFEITSKSSWQKLVIELLSL